MNGYERTVAFVNGQPVDHPPFMPLVIDWVAKQKDISTSDFVYKPEVRAQAYLEITEQYDIDCILPDTDFYEQLEDFGQVPRWTDDGYVAYPLLEDLSRIDELSVPAIKPGTRQGNRVEIIRRIAETAKGEKYIFGTCIGPFTEYCTARTIEKAMEDLVSHPDAVQKGMDLFFENGMNFIRAQMEAGADGIQIVEPECALLSPEVYRKLVFPYHEKMVREIQKNGGFCRIHICGDTSLLVPHTLATGTRILEADSQVDLTKVIDLLGEDQVFCGNLDVTKEVEEGDPSRYQEYVDQRIADAKGRIIIAAGCDVPENTPAENMIAWHQAVVKAGASS